MPKAAVPFFLRGKVEIVKSQRVFDFDVAFSRFRTSLRPCKSTSYSVASVFQSQVHGIHRFTFLRRGKSLLGALQRK